MGVLFGIFFILSWFSLFDLNFLFLSRLIWCSNFMGYVIFCGTIFEDEQQDEGLEGCEVGWCPFS